MECINSWAMMILSDAWRPGMKAHCDVEISLLITPFSLFAMTLDITLVTTFESAIGRN